MIEKIMKAVKSGNKKRGRNMTIGAVVGMLLSCITVMGADEYLWIKNTEGLIEFNKENTSNRNPGEWKEVNPHEENEWNGITYINNMVLSSNTVNGTIGGGNINYGLRLSSSGSYGEDFIVSFINNGSIAVTNTSNNNVHGIYVEAHLGSLINNGSIAVTDTVGYDTFGIYINGLFFHCNIESIANTGLIILEARTSRGIDISETTTKAITNDGIIKVAASINYSYGISTGSNSKIENLTNNGSLIMTGSRDNYGIFNAGQIKSMLNTGLMKETVTGANGGAYGLFNNMGTIEETMLNSGLIVVIGKGSEASSGIYNSDYSQLADIINSGLINGINTESGTGSGIYNGKTNNAIINSITNTGVIYGTNNAIKNDTNGVITSSNNYGLLISDTDETVSGMTLTNNYGLIFKASGGSYTTTTSDYSKFGQLNDADGYTIINAKAEGRDENNITGSENLKLENEKLTYGGSQIENISLSKKYILNGITDTLLVSTGDNKLDNSVINAYKTAVKFNSSTGGELTLLGTMVNGGVDGTSNVVSGSNERDILTLENGSIVNGNINMENGNDIFVAGSETRINGNIDMGAGDDTLTLKNGTIINGTIAGGNGDDTLNFNSSVTRTSNSSEINIQHSISDFENMNINTNVTLFEKTVKDDGTPTDLTITGAENITIGANGVLTLRIDSTNIDDTSGTDKIIGHALYGNTGTITSIDGGKLLLVINGAGNNSVISFGNTEFGDGFITGKEGKYQEDVTFETTSLLHSIEKVDLTNNKIKVTTKVNLPRRAPEDVAYEKLNEIYHSILSVEDLIGNFNVDDDEKLSTFLGYLNDIYAGSPYSYSSELSRKSMGMFRDIVVDNIFRPENDKWMIYGGLTHVDGGTKDTYYGKGYYTTDIGSSDMDTDTKITGAYMLGEYGVSDTLTSGVVIGGNKLKSDLSNGSKVDGSAMYLGAYAKKYIGNLKVTAGAGFQYGDYDADRLAVNKVASDSAESVMKYSDNYNDITYDIYLNGRYSHNIGDNLFLEPYATLSYTYIDQDGANEGSKALAIETDSKSFDYTVGKVGADLKKVIPHEKGKSTLSAGVSYTKILDGAEEEYITGRFKGGSNFDILVAHKNEHSIGLNAKYALELENGVIFDVKGTYSVERDSHNGSGKNRTKGEWIVGAGLGYKF